MTLGSNLQRTECVDDFTLGGKGDSLLCLVFSSLMLDTVLTVKHGLNANVGLLSQVTPRHSKVLLLAVLVKKICVLSKFVTFCPSVLFIVPFLSWGEVP